VSEDNERVVRRVVEEVYNGGRMEVVDELVSPAFVHHDPATGEHHGTGAVKQRISTYRAMLPDLRVTIEDMISSGDRVVTRWSSRGTHSGESGGVAPTGRTVTSSGIMIDRLEGGRIAETWSHWDNAGLAAQLAAEPEAVAD
jgi:steroid delta-isomerase-like uncharacterized protein